MKKTPTVSIIAVCYNARAYIERWIQHLPTWTDHTCEIIIVNDGSTDITGDICILHPELTYIRLDKNFGASYARNRGVQIAQGTFICFVDIDCFPEKNTLQSLVQFLETLDTLGAVQPLLINAHTQTPEAVGHFMTPFGLPYEVTEVPLDKKPIPIFGAKTTMLCMTKKLFNTIGGFDEDYVIYSEDTDLSWRIHNAGKAMYCIPTVQAHHFQKSSISEATKHRIWYEGCKNSVSTIIKNATIPQLVVFIPALIMTWMVFLAFSFIRGNLQASRSIASALGYTLVNIVHIWHKRKTIVRTNPVPIRQLCGPITPAQLAHKGIQWIMNTL